MSDIEFTMITTAILLYASAIGMTGVFIHTLYSIYKEYSEFCKRVYTRYL